MTNKVQGFQLKGNALTNVGKVRTHNEDSVHLWKREDIILAIVADGMGGAAAGEEASRIAVETITESINIEARAEQPSLEITAKMLRSAVQKANVSIMNEAIDQPQNKGMGTTLTMVVIEGNDAQFAHVGDSRAYRVDKHKRIEQVTADHSFVQALLDAGHITEEQAETHPMGNVLYRALGQTQDLDVDTYRLRLNVGDRLVLCSDGLTRHVRSFEIGDIAGSLEDPTQISSELVNLANARGGEDNISVITIIVDGSEMAINANRLRAIEDALDDDPDTEDTIVLRRTTPSVDMKEQESALYDDSEHDSTSLDAHARLEYGDRMRRHESHEQTVSASGMLHEPRTGRFEPNDLEGRDGRYPNLPQ